MPYPSGTILTRVDPLEKDVHGVNKLRIIGISPVRPNEHILDWGEAKGDGWIVQPVDAFGANQVAPESVLANFYEVESYPDESATETVVDPAAARRAQLETPEQVFAREARVKHTVKK